MRRATFEAHDTKNNGVVEAVEILGGARATAEKLGVSSTAVLKWIYVSIPAQRAVQLERLTEIPRERMRPDLFER